MLQWLIIVGYHFYNCRNVAQKYSLRPVDIRRKGLVISECESEDEECGGAEAMDSEPETVVAHSELPEPEPMATVLEQPEPEPMVTHPEQPEPMATHPEKPEPGPVVTYPEQSDAEPTVAEQVSVEEKLLSEFSVASEKLEPEFILSATQPLHAESLLALEQMSQHPEPASCPPASTTKLVTAEADLKVVEIKCEIDGEKPPINYEMANMEVLGRIEKVRISAPSFYFATQEQMYLGFHSRV